MCPRGSSSPLAIPMSFPGLSYPVFKGIMKKGYKVPTPIQRKVRGGEADAGREVGMANLALLPGLLTSTPCPICHPLLLWPKPHEPAHFTGGESRARQSRGSTLCLFAT